MNPARLDWDFLRQDMLIPLSTMAVMLGLLLVSVWFHAAEKALYAEYVLDQENVHRDYDELVYRRSLVDRYHRRYDRFRKQGFVGRENRLDWVESIRSVATRLELPHVAYIVEPQLEVTPPVTSVQGSADIRIHGSKLEIVLGLLHEGDLLGFFSGLKAEAPGLMKVDRCSIARQVTDGELATDRANLLATCKLTIFSLITSDVIQASGGS